MNNLNGIEEIVENSSLKQYLKEIDNFVYSKDLNGLIGCVIDFYQENGFDDFDLENKYFAFEEIVAALTPYDKDSVEGILNDASFQKIYSKEDGDCFLDMFTTNEFIKAFVNFRKLLSMNVNMEDAEAKQQLELIESMQALEAVIESSESVNDIIDRNNEDDSVKVEYNEKTQEEINDIMNSLFDEDDEDTSDESILFDK